MRILLLRHRSTGRSSRRRYGDADRCSGGERIGWIDDDFIGSRAGAAATARVEDLLLPFLLSL